MAMSIEDITCLLVKRDNISYNEARYLVEECRREVNELAAEGASYDEVADTIADFLGLEPEYMDVLLDF